MTDYMPSTDDPQLEDVREWYIAGRRTHNPFASDADLVHRFDRWLADHDAEVRADAWDEGAQWAAVECGVEGDFLAPGDNPYREDES